MRRLVDEVRSLSSANVQTFRQRIGDRVHGLLADSASEQRLEYEVLLYAERIDITEEVVRLTAHIEEAGNTLRNSATEMLGKRLDFLAQEMMREASTMSQKTHSAAATHRIIDLKLEVERVREQVQNLL